MSLLKINKHILKSKLILEPSFRKEKCFKRKDFIYYCFHEGRQKRDCIFFWNCIKIIGWFLFYKDLEFMIQVKGVIRDDIFECLAGRRDFSLSNGTCN